MARQLKGIFLLRVVTLGMFILSGSGSPRHASARQYGTRDAFSPSNARVGFSGRAVRTWVSPSEYSGAVTNFLFREVRFAKGGGGQDSVVITLPGGTLERERYEIAGAPPERFQIGKRYVVLLHELASFDHGVSTHVADYRVLERVGPEEEDYVEMGPGDLTRMGKDTGLLTEDEFLARCAPFVREAGRTGR